MPQESDDALTNAVARNAAAVLSLPSAGMLRHHKSRFLAETTQSVWLESVPAEHLLIQELIAGKQNCGVSFKAGERKVSFAARVLDVNPSYKVNDAVSLPAILLERPDCVRPVQRRTNYRVKVPEDVDLKLQMWRLPTHTYLGDRPPRTAELSVLLKDLSIGGLGVQVLARGDEPPKITEGERVRVLLSGESREEILLEGRIRSLRNNADGTVATGVGFVKLQDALEGRRIATELTKIVGMLQFEEVRRHRRGAA